jgi:hypothetical protein
MLDRSELDRACRLGAAKVAGDGCVLVLLNADDDCVVTLAGKIREIAPTLDVPLVVVVANREFESLFLAGSPSLADASRFSSRYTGAAPEEVRGAKEAVSHLIVGGTYRETVHQVELTAVVSLAEARACRWYRKLEQGVLEVLGGQWAPAAG